MNKAWLRPLMLALAVLVANPVSAQISSRKTINPEGQFAKLTGQIAQAGPSDGEFANGFIIGTEGCHILTNFHVAFGKAKDSNTGVVEMVDDVKVGHRVNFAFDLDATSGKFKRTVIARVVEFGNYEAGTSRGFLGDIALLRLEMCLGEEYGHLEIDRPGSNKILPTGKLMTVSSSRNLSGKNEILAEEGCRPDNATTIVGMMLASCEIVGGMSGSMILEEGADKQWRLVGIATAAGAIENGKQVTKAIYAIAINKFLDGALGKWSVAPFVRKRKP